MRHANETKPPLGTNPDGLSEGFGYPRECSTGANCHDATQQLGWTFENVVTHPNAKDNCCHGTKNSMAVQYEAFPPIDPVQENNEYIRYCLCDEGWMGSSCELEMKPWVPWSYIGFGLVLTTGLAAAVLGPTAFLDFASEKRVFKETMTDKQGQEVPFMWSGLNLFFQYYLMGCGAFVYSVSWTDDFILVEILRALSNIFMGAFEVIGDILLPDDYTNNDATAIKMALATSVPMLLYVQALTGKQKNPKTGQTSFTYFGNKVIYVIMPALTIPVVGTLFRPIVGCHFDSSSMNPRPLNPEDESTRKPPIEMQFLPISMRQDCAFGDQTETYFWMGIGLMIPFWAVGIYFGSLGKTDTMTFPVHRGYHVIHTQLMVIVAMAYRAFKMRHPMYLTTTLLIVNLIEVALVVVFKPNDHLPINRMRLYVVSLSVLFSCCGFLAQLVDDRTSWVSAIVLCISTLGWAGGVGYMVFGGGGGGGAPQPVSDLELVEDSEDSEDGED
jgi:hypothetical protein